MVNKKKANASVSVNEKLKAEIAKEAEEWGIECISDEEEVQNTPQEPQMKVEPPKPKVEAPAPKVEESKPEQDQATKEAEVDELAKMLAGM